MVRIASLLIAVVLGVWTVVPAFGADGGTIEGTIVNKTAGGGPVGRVEVTLTTYFGETERNKATATTDDQGKFTFTGLDTSPNYTYEAVAKYQQVDYTASRVSFSRAGEMKRATLEVYDSTADPSVVKAGTKHYVLSPNKGQLEVTEILVLRNETDKSYIGEREVGPDQRATTRYEAPAGAKSVEYGQGLMSCCVVPDGAGFVDTMPVRPGEDQKIFNYKLPYTGDTLGFATTLQQPVERIQILVPSGVKANISGLASHGTQNIQGAAYQVFSGENLAAETSLQVDLEGLPENQFSDSPIVLAGIGLATLAALGAAFFVLRRRSQPAQSPVPAFVPAPATRRAQPGKAGSMKSPAASPALVELEKQELLTAMANLDDWFEEGRIGAKDYERLRAEKKARLLVLMQRNDGRTPARV